MPIRLASVSYFCLFPVLWLLTRNIMAWHRREWAYPYITDYAIFGWWQWRSRLLTGMTMAMAMAMGMSVGVANASAEQNRFIYFFPRFSAKVACVREKRVEVSERDDNYEHDHDHRHPHHHHHEWMNVTEKKRGRRNECVFGVGKVEKAKEKS